MLVNNFKILPRHRILFSSSSLRQSSTKNKIKEKLKTQEDVFEDEGHPRVALTKDHRTIVMYHPPKNVPYEKSIPIPRNNKHYTMEDNLDSKIITELNNLGIADRRLDLANVENPFPYHNKERMPLILKLVDMFKQDRRYFMKKQYENRRKRIKKEPVYDRPLE